MNEGQYLSDLKWLLAEQEVFVVDVPLAEFLAPDYEQRLYSLEQQPEPLAAHMKRAKSHFLGSYFEQLFSFAIQHFTQLTVLAEHQQIQVQGKTLGEIDLLARDQYGRCLQFEVALKFYLQRPDLAPYDWMGPNKNDSLKKKLDHARSHQLTVLDHDAGRQWFESVSGARAYSKNLMIFGRHFYDLNEVSRDGIKQLSLRSGWLYVSQLALWKSCLFDLVIAQKPCWITPTQENTEKHQINGDFINWLQQSFIQDERPKLFSCCRRLCNGEIALFWLFICPDHW